MGLYEDEFGRAETGLERDEATDRAYAIGVAERFGEFNREELERIHAAMDSAYLRSMVELAYEEGRNEAKEAASNTDAGKEAVWDDLVTGEKTLVDPDETPTGGRDGLPAALEPTELLDRQRVDRSEAIDRPGFLDR